MTCVFKHRKDLQYAIVTLQYQEKYIIYLKSRKLCVIILYMFQSTYANLVSIKILDINSQPEISLT